MLFELLNLTVSCFAGILMSRGNNNHDVNVISLAVT
jgi:hypothetical protein